MDLSYSPRKNPSRKECEEQIKKILSKEVLLEHGKNHHFKTAADFMVYFESLYPSGPGLTKQVQRAVKAMDMPKDENGYFIINKTKTQLDQEVELRHLLERTDAEIIETEEAFQTVFLKADRRYRAYLMELIGESETFRGKYLTMVDTTEGLVFLTANKQQLTTLLKSLL